MAIVQGGGGAEVDAAVRAAHRPLGRKISATGSPATQKAVLKAAAEKFTPTLLELGGKNGILVFQDADVERAVRDTIEGAFFNQDEACTAASRLIVHRSIYERFVERLSVGVCTLKVGDGAVEGTQVTRRLDNGVILVNNYCRDFIDTPFGRAKASGYGRESSVETLKEFGRLKAIRFPSGEGRPPSWFAVTKVFSDPKSSDQISPAPPGVQKNDTDRRGGGARLCDPDAGRTRYVGHRMSAPSSGIRLSLPLKWQEI